MKKLLYILGLGVLLAACNVDVENPNTLRKENFWQTPRDAQYGVNAAYNMFYKPGTFSRWLWFRLDLTSDEAMSTSPWGELREWTDFIYNNYNFWEGNAWTYRDFYEAIFRCNQVLVYGENITFDSQEQKDRIFGQAYFLRGLYYNYLGMLWGGPEKSLAIVLEPSEPSDTPVGHTETEVYAQALSDLDQASKMLPDSWGESDKGRATKGAAYAFMAKIYMQQHKWTEARTALDWLVTGAGKSNYGLVDNYQDNFTHFTENNKESVFEIQYSDANKAPAGDGDFDVDPNMGLNRGQFFAPPGIGWTDGELCPWIVTEFKKEADKNGNVDIRLKYTAFYKEMSTDFENNKKIYRYQDGWGSDWNKDRVRVFFRKYGTDYYRDYDDYHNPCNVRLIRYADILLMYAECLVNESAANLATAVGYVNQVRDRADMKPLADNHADATTDATKFLKRLQMERMLELATEGWRWADIKRWGLTSNETGLDELKARDGAFNNFVIGKHDRLPIPSDETLNNKGLTQNPKY